MSKRSVRGLDVRNKGVLVRVDFNVPMQDGSIIDDTRIMASLPTIHYLIEHNARVILVSHLGRPKGRVVEDLRMRPVAERLARLLGRSVEVAPDSVGPEVRARVEKLAPGSVLLLENIRFHAEEEKNDPKFSRELASLADLYVNDAFGTAHRAHASTEGVAHFLPAAAGLLMERELDVLGGLLQQPEHPFVVIIGGAKISTKMAVLRHLLPIADAFLIGGGMANTLLLAEGVNVGQSLVEDDQLETAREFLEAARIAGRDVILPVDVVVTPEIRDGGGSRVVSIDDIPQEWRIADIGPDTIHLFGECLKDARTVVWNGPMGVFEVPPFSKGTEEIARLLASTTAMTVVGGGDSVAAVEQTGLADRIDHISTGGGASLEFLEGKPLPGIEVLPNA